MVRTIKTASVVAAQRCYADFSLYCRKVLADFFGFDGIGILYRDRRDNNLFSIEETEDQADQKILQIREERDKKGEELTQEE